MSDITGYDGPERRKAKRRAVDTQLGLLGHVDTLNDNVEDLSGKVEELNREVVADRAARDRKWRWILIGFITTALALVLVAFAIVSNRALVREQQRQGREQERTTHILLECTTPSNPTAKDADDRVHECYENAQRAQAEAVRQIIDALRTNTTTTQP